MYEGVLNVYKERGFTSHDVVAKLRGILKMKKIGHTGTLDPDAEGVLPVCLGQATRLCGMLTDEEKTYRAVMLLGVETDTQDTSGRVVRRVDVSVPPRQVEEAVLGFVGPYAQVPPMYSALKVNGRKLCELARQGRTVERPARPVTIYGIDIESVDLPRVTMTVRCSKGTYIRTLCHDIGQKLGCGACMESLLRVRVGRFGAEESLRLSQIEELRDGGGLERHIVPVEEMFSAYPRAYAAPEADKPARNGNPLRLAQVRLESGAFPAGGGPCAEEDHPSAPLAEPCAEEERSRMFLADRLCAEGDHPSAPLAEPCAEADRLCVPLADESCAEAADRPRAPRAEAAAPRDGERFRAYDSRGTFLGIYVYEREKDRLKPYKIFLKRDGA